MTHTVDVTGTGSLINALYRQSSQPVPEVGMGATILLWTDRHAGTITQVSADKTRMWVARDTATRLDTHGISERQVYAYARNEYAVAEAYSLRKNSRWVKQGESMAQGTSLHIGIRDEYHDYTF